MIIFHKKPPFKTILLSAAFVLLSACSDDDGASTDRDDTADASYKLTLTTAWAAADFPTRSECQYRYRECG